GGADEDARQRAMAEQEVPQHRGGREQVGNQDLPPDEHVLHGPAEDADDAEEERLEAREEDDHGDDEGGLPLGRGDDGGRDDPERDEGETVDHGIAQDGQQSESDADRRLHPVEERGPEEHRGLERMTPERVDDEEPHGDDDRADDASDDAFAQDGALRTHHGTSGVILALGPGTGQPDVANATSGITSEPDAVIG